jgi:hypothetical protein
MAGALAVIVTVLPTSMAGLVAGETIWNPEPAIVVVAGGFPLLQCTSSKQRTTQRPATWIRFTI